MSIAYCRQVPLELQESPYMLDDAGYEGMNTLGNRDYVWRVSDELKNVMDNWNYAYEDWANFQSDPTEFTYKSVREVIENYFPPLGNRKAYSDEDIDHVVEALHCIAWSEHQYEEYKAYAKLLAVQTGHEWKYQQIRGTSQSDWQEVIFDATLWNSEAVEAFEAEYFNTGTEWEVHDGENIPECADDVEGYYLYITDWNDERGLKEALGVDELVLWRPTTIVRKYNYECERV